VSDDKTPLGVEPTSGRYPVTRDDLTHKLRLHSLRAMALALSAIVGSVVSAYSFLIDRAEAAADAGLAPMSRLVDTTWNELQRYERANDSNVQSIRDEVIASRNDIRAVYRAPQYGKNEPTLDKDLPTNDAGHKDAGQ